MIPFELQISFPAGSLLVGGYSAVPRWLDGVHATDAKDNPIIPATALRGALRESLEALLRGAGENACQGGTGLEPGSQNTPTPCTSGESGVCKACRLFGTQRKNVESEERFFSALILGEAILEGDRKFNGWRDTYNVSISRSHRSAEDKRLFNRRAPSLINQKMIAKGYLLDESLKQELSAAVNATTHIGSGRSRGLARVDISIKWFDPVPTFHAKEDNNQDLWIRVTLQTPAAIGGVSVDNNLRDSRSEIPGAMLRGALGFALARALPDPNGHKLFQALVSEEGAHFGFLYPTDSESGKAQLSAPWPITARGCKTDPAHPRVDTLVDRICASLIDTSEQALLLKNVSDPQCSRCGSPLRGVPGTRNSASRVASRLVTRVALDRHTSSASEGKLFSQSLVEANSSFEGSIRNIPKGAAGLLKSISERPVFIGRAASAGHGKAKIQILEAPSVNKMSERAEKFVSNLREKLKKLSIPFDAVDCLVPVTLLSPLLPDEGDDGSKTLCAALGEGVTCHLGLRRFVRDGAWDQRSGELLTKMFVAAGSVFVLKLPGSYKELLEKLQQLEQNSVGHRRYQGFGHVICFDTPFLKEK